MRTHLKVIHAKWGFFGGVALEQIYFSRAKQQVCFINWSRCHLAFRVRHTKRPFELLWPYNCMLRGDGEIDYLCLDELAIFCCFSKFLNLQSKNAEQDDPETDKLKQLVSLLKKLVTKLMMIAADKCL